jgi:hypothetical protein
LIFTQFYSPPKGLVLTLWWLDLLVIIAAITLIIAAVMIDNILGIRAPAIVAVAPFHALPPPID